MPVVVWTDEATQKLIALFIAGMSREEMARNLGTTRAAVYQKLHRLDIRSPAQVDPLKGHDDKIMEYATAGKSDSWIAKQLGASPYQVRNRRRRLKIAVSYPKSWTRQEDDLLLSMVRLGSVVKDVAKHLEGRSKEACWCRLALLRRDGIAERRKAPEKTRAIKAEPRRLLPLEKQESEWDELLAPHYPDDSDRKPFAATEDGDPDPGDKGVCDLPRLSVGMGGSSMGWAA